VCERDIVFYFVVRLAVHAAGAVDEEHLEDDSRSHDTYLTKTSTTLTQSRFLRSLRMVGGVTKSKNEPSPFAYSSCTVYSMCLFRSHSWL
jgi:hypothetical protein